jgi:hypothetical protein
MPRNSRARKEKIVENTISYGTEIACELLKKQKYKNNCINCDNLLSMHKHFILR